MGNDFEVSLGLLLKHIYPKLLYCRLKLLLQYHCFWNHTINTLIF